jgi:hypothetical protein
LNSLPSPEQVIDWSDAALQSAELAALDEAAQAWKRAKKDMEIAREAEAKAWVLRWMLDERDTFIRLSRTVVDGKQAMLRFDEFELMRKAS